MGPVELELRILEYTYYQGVRIGACFRELGCQAVH